jgi:hypothetical protein
MTHLKARQILNKFVRKHLFQRNTFKTTDFFSYVDILPYFIRENAKSEQKIVGK